MRPAPATPSAEGSRPGSPSGDDLVAAARRGAATAGAAVRSSGSLRLLGPAARRAAERLLGLYEAGEPARIMPPVNAGEGEDSDVMEREIATIPDVIRDRLSLAGQAQETIDRLREAQIRHLVLVGCGDSFFACEAAALALNRYSGLRVHAEHALDFARYTVRYHPPGTAVIVVSFSGKTGRPIEAAHQARAFGHPVIALTGRVDGPLAQQADWVLSAEIPTFGFSPGTSTYTAMLVTLLTLAAELGAVAERPPAGLDDYRARLHRLPELAEQTLRLSDAAGARRQRPPGRRSHDHLPGRGAQRGQRQVRGRQAVRGSPADRGVDEHRGVGPRGVLHHPGGRAGDPGRAPRRVQ